jgi:dihydropteroate synthase
MNAIEQTLELLSSDRAVIMGILNVTPDSFSDGGRFASVEPALAHALEMQAQGADIIDIGGESTRPGAESVSVDEELRRVIPVIEALRQHSQVPISIDTSKPEVMCAAVAAGASLVNDVYALRAPGAIATCAELAVPVCLMHMQGEPRSMQQNPGYQNVVAEISEFLLARAQACIDHGIAKQHIILDPGFGFGKTTVHNLRMLAQIRIFCDSGFPILVGISRKSMLGAILDRAVEERLSGSIAAAVLAWQQGARFFRVHDVAETVDALRLCEAVTDAMKSLYPNASIGYEE